VAIYIYLLDASAEPNVGECCKHGTLPNNILISALFTTQRAELKIIHSLLQRNICRGEFGVFIPKRGTLHFHNDHSLLSITIAEI
jgi:hypothetical protein